MHRFFIDKDAIKGDLVKITGSDFNHISHSLRLEVDDKIILCSGDGLDLIVSLNEIHEDHIVGEIIEKRKNKNEPELKVSVAQAIPKKRNMELVVQKCTEIGVHKIIPLATKRTIVELKGKKKDRRINRWQRIAEEAAKQSQRGIIPEICDIYTLDKLVTTSDNYDLILILWEDEKRSNLKDILSNYNRNNINNILVLIGPEGGFPENEVDLIEKAGGHPVTMGPRILRTETAGLVGLTMLLYEFGDLGG